MSAEHAWFFPNMHGAIVRRPELLCSLHDTGDGVPARGGGVSDYGMVQAAMNGVVQAIVIDAAVSA